MSTPLPPEETNSGKTSSGKPTPSPVVRLADLPLTRQQHGATFEALTAAIAAPAGATHLGARLVELPPGKKGWPLHCHHGNDELFVILEGRGHLRLGANRHAVAAGDVVVCPAGGPDAAHQLCAAPDTALRYLAVSSMRAPDVMQYPDSGKIMVMAGSAPGGSQQTRTLSRVLRDGPTVDYWDGET